MKSQLPLLPTREQHARESKVFLNNGIWHITFLNVQFTLGQANEVFFLSSSPLPQKTDSMCRIRKILVLADQYTELFGHFTYALLRKIRLHFLLKSLLPWSLVFESSYPVLPEHLSTQSFVLKKKKAMMGYWKKAFFITMIMRQT